MCLRLRLPFVSLFAFGGTAIFIACTTDTDNPSSDGPDARADAPFIDGGRTDGSGSNDGSSGSIDAKGSDTSVDTGPADLVPPGAIGDLAATTKTHAAVDLTWSAPSDDPDAGASSPEAGSGTVAGYEVRYATTPITTLAEYLAAPVATTTVITAVPAGQQQTATVTGLTPNTAYHFVVRAHDAANNFGGLSNDATATTKARAKVLITEVTLANGAAQGFDFVELLATETGTAEGLEIKQLNTVLYTLGAFDLTAGDRVLVHASGLTAPEVAGFVQEDVTKDKASSLATVSSATAYDVYSSTSGLTGTDNAISVLDGNVISDAVVISNRDGDVTAASLLVWAGVQAGTAWTFGIVPTTDGCLAQRDAVSIAEADTAMANCGGAVATSYGSGISINRNGTTDTNSKADFYLASQTPGAANGALPEFRVIGTSSASATNLTLTFNQEVAPATVAAAGFTIAGLTVSAATVTDLFRVTLTTTAQAEQPYSVVAAGSVTSINGTTNTTPTIRACGFSATPAVLTISEVSPDLDGGGDLVELVATTRGSLGGYEVRQNPTALATPGALLATLPSICADAGDAIVVHLSPSAVVGLPLYSEGVVSKTEFAQASFASNYDGAWDVLGGAGVGATSQVIAVRSLALAWNDAVPFSKGTATGIPVGFVPALQFIQANGLWTPINCGGVPCDATTTPTAFDATISASWSGVSTSVPTGNSVRRISAGKTAANWAVGASSFGVANP